MASSNSGCNPCSVTDETKIPVGGVEITLLVAMAIIMVVMMYLLISAFRLYSDLAAAAATQQRPANPRQRVPGLTLQQVQQRHEASSRDHAVITIKGHDNDDECAICCSEAKEETPSLPCMWRVLACQHRFHSDCIKIWLEINKTCPLCRKIVR